MNITGVTTANVYDSYTYTNNTTATQEVTETPTQVTEETKTAVTGVDVKQLFEAQQGASASVNITQADSTGTSSQTTTQSSGSAEEEEEETTVELVFNADGSVEQVTTTTDAEGNETVERVQISGPTESKAATEEGEQGKLSTKMQKAIESYQAYEMV